MKCVVTAGPTQEPLDEVRRLTNVSTGRLGSQLAEFLSREGHDVILLRSRFALYQGASKVHRLVEFDTAADLEKMLEDCKRDRVDAVFHAAAVSDFRFGKVWSRTANGDLREVRLKKISTRNEGLLAELVPAKKIIGELRRWFPQAWLVGWKYELDGSKAQAIALGLRQIKANRTDACVVNGAAYGKGFGLVCNGRKCLHCPDVPALLRQIARRLHERSER